MPVIEVLEGTYALRRLASGSGDAGSFQDPRGFLSLSTDSGGLSLVCREDAPGTWLEASGGWRVFRVRGPLDFGLVGILASIASPLAAAGIPLFSVSTWETDHVLVKAVDLERAAAALAGAGWEILRP